MEYQRVIIRNIKSSNNLDRAALQLHNYFAKNFKSLKYNFLTSGNSHKGYMMVILCDQPIEDETLYLCLGYVVRVLEELANLFGE
jgi:hypothetical protein